MTERTLPADFRRLLDEVSAKRPRTVIQHILKHGQVTTEELQSRYGYNHPPRAIRDVRELGIPIETFRVTGTDGRSIAAYRFGDPEKVRAALTGRSAFRTGMKKELVEKHGSRCSIYLEDFPSEDLQVDHRIPFEISGDDAADDPIGTCSCAPRRIGRSHGVANIARTGRRGTRKHASPVIGRIRRHIRMSR